MIQASAFPTDYADGRRKFLEAAEAAGASIGSYQNPLRGPAGERLFTDVAWVGPRDARRVLVTMSGTHGVEGFMGSGVQTAALRAGYYGSLPANAAVLLVHAITPWGFAWLRRTTEDGVDLCRNFMDFTRPLPHNAFYDEMAEVLVPADWTGQARQAADARLLGWIADHGIASFKAGVAAGQYDHWYVPFYGGQAPTWSNRTFREIVRTYLGEAREVVFIDYHTGLGVPGIGQLLCFHQPDDDAYERGRDAWGDTFVSVFSDDTVAYDVTGGVLPALEEELPNATVTAAAYEFGTIAETAVLEALRADHWLHTYGDLDSDLATQIKSAIRDAFYVDSDTWRSAVTDQSHHAEHRGLALLAGS